MLEENVHAHKTGSKPPPRPNSSAFDNLRVHQYLRVQGRSPFLRKPFQIQIAAMSASLSSIRVPPDALPAVNAQLSYFASGDNPAEVRVYPPGSGIATVRPASIQHLVSIRDARPIANQLRLDEQ